MTILERTRLVLPLCAVSLISIVLGCFFDIHGLLINLGTELIGILVTIIYVDIVIANNEQRKWKPVAAMLKKEIYITSNALVASLRTAFKITPNDFFEPGFMYELAGKNEREMALDILTRYKKKISTLIYEYIAKMTEGSWQTLIANFGNVHNACINFQSMYNAISSPKQIHCIMTLTNETYHIISQLQLFPEYYTMSNDEFRNMYDDEKIEFKMHSQKILGETINNLLDLLYDEVNA